MAKQAGDVREPTKFERPTGDVPTAPNVPGSFLLVQFWRDIFGKEVQSAATYSYLWMADQMGHVALGIILQFTLTFLLQHVLGVAEAWASGIALVGISAVVSFWEYRAYSASAAKAQGNTFPLDKTLLRDNAVIASAYMVFGVLGGYAFHLPGWWGAGVFVVALLLCVVCAPKWLRQKIIWQKAALPYLSRLADLNTPVAEGPAEAIRRFVHAPERDASKPADWRQIVIAGAIGSGRTPMVTGLGTDLAFAGRKVRYMSFDDLVEIDDQFVAGRPLPPLGSWGPANIFYWPWFESEVLLIDNVSPAVVEDLESATADDVRSALTEKLPHIRDVLCGRNTVWVFGLDHHLSEEEAQRLVEQYASVIQNFCNSGEPPITVRLPAPPWLEAARASGHVGHHHA
ncbi:MAG: hypothetical protein KDC18_04935 [Alphaproteobacteria bacterium]|nr:hypothetical protein [Alphaproteobacteria bacterium]MCB9928730.1 hypothetical protein [Alphaproteobacteria bacterium]